MGDDLLRVDLAIVGGGFAGSLMALLAERIGLKAAVLEKDAHPRFAVGESSTPAGNMVLRSLADRYGISWLRPLSRYGPWREAHPELAAGRKRGFSYFRQRRGRRFRPRPDHRDELLVTANRSDYRSDTHWLRADVDAHLAERVRAAGVPFFEDTEVRAVQRTGKGFGADIDAEWRVLARGPEGDLEVRADLVVGAAGSAGGLRRALTVPDRTDRLATRSRALFTHFRDVRSWESIVKAQGGSVEDYPFACDDAALHHVFDDAWMWVLRFSDGRVSAGLVTPEHPRPSSTSGSIERAEARAGRSEVRSGSPDRSDEDPRTEWIRRIERYPSVRYQFAKAEMVDPPGRVVRTDLMQHHAARAAGRAWALVPSAAGFSGPLHSTGIAHTLTGVERLGRVLERFRDGREIDELLRRYDRVVRRELLFVDRLIVLAHRSLHSFRAFRSACRYYFAAATTYERRRSERPDDPVDVADGTGGKDAFEDDGFLCAGDEGLRKAVSEALRRVPGRGRDAQGDDVAEFERLTERLLDPYDEVGLFDPPVPNMYPHTAAPD